MMSHFPRFSAIPGCTALFLSPNVLRSEVGRSLATGFRGRAPIGICERTGHDDLWDVPTDFRRLPRVHWCDSDMEIMRSVGLEGEGIQNTLMVVSDDEMDLEVSREPEHRPRYIFCLSHLPPELRRLAR